MKALSKDPEQRYQCGQDLVNDLERCKESATKTSAKKATPAPPANAVPRKAVTAAPAKAKESVPAAVVPKPVLEKSRPDFAAKPHPKRLSLLFPPCPRVHQLPQPISEFEVKAERSRA